MNRREFQEAVLSGLRKMERSLEYHAPLGHPCEHCYCITAEPGDVAMQFGGPYTTSYYSVPLEGHAICCKCQDRMKIPDA